MFESLSQKIEKAVHRLSGRSRLTEINVAEAVKDIRRALLDADVSYKVAKQFTDDVRDKALGANVLTSLHPGQVMVKIVRDEMAALMGTSSSELELKGHFNVVLMAGLQGSGKTTFTAKLANFLQKKKGKKVLLVAGDVYRPAAIDQLQVLGGQIGADVFTLEGDLLNQPLLIGFDFRDFLLFFVDLLFEAFGLLFEFIGFALSPKFCLHGFFAHIFVRDILFFVSGLFKFPLLLRSESVSHSLFPATGILGELSFDDGARFAFTLS